MIVIKLNFNKIWLMPHLSIIVMIIYKLKTNHKYFDYFLTVSLFWYGYYAIFDRDEILNTTLRDRKILAFCALPLLFHILFFDKFIRRCIL